jgi:hypothetical protein
MSDTEAKKHYSDFKMAHTEKAGKISLSNINQFLRSLMSNIQPRLLAVTTLSK